MGFNSAFKGLELLKKNRERTFEQFKWPRPQCVMKLCEFQFHVRLIFWRVTSRWGSVLKMDPSVSSETWIGVELYNIASPKTIFHFHRHEHLRSSPQYVFFSSCRRSVVLLTRRGGRRRFYPCNSAKLLE